MHLACPEEHSQDMSDEEYEYGSDADCYQYGSEEDAEPQDDLIEIENAFFEGDDARADDPEKALEMFLKVVRLESELGKEVKWRFKALEHLVTLYFHLGRLNEMVKCYEELLTFVGDVTRNECTDSINNILETVGGCKDLEIIGKAYTITIEALHTAGNERMLFSIHMKLAKAYLQGGDYTRAEEAIQELHHSCQLPDGTDDTSKGNLLLDVYGLLIQLCTATRNSRLMRETYPRIMSLNAAVEDPRTMGVVREEGGKMYMSMGQWNNAYNEFYEGFRNYQEAGNSHAKVCLKYVVLASMLALSDINPFAAREAKVFQEDREIAALLDLRLAYEGNDLTSFESILRSSPGIQDDPFVMQYVEPLRFRMKEQVILAIVRPYQRIQITFIAQETNLSIDEVEHMLVKLIHDTRIAGTIDQIQGFLELGGAQQLHSSRKHGALSQWGTALRLCNTQSSGWKSYLPSPSAQANGVRNFLSFLKKVPT